VNNYQAFLENHQLSHAYLTLAKRHFNTLVKELITGKTPATGAEKKQLFSA